MTTQQLKRYASNDFKTSKGKTALIGTGSYTKVIRCWHPTLKDVAIKCYQSSGSEEKLTKTRENAEREANILHRISHKNIVKFHGIVEWDKYGENVYGIILEEVCGGNLEEFIYKSNHNHLEKKVPWGLRLRFFIDLADAINYLHYKDPNRSFIHGDLKPQNVFLTTSLRIKLGDFGSCHLEKAAGVGTMSLDLEPNPQHTLLYTAPEYLKESDSFEMTCSMDIYSFSMIGYEIITLIPVYSNSHAPQNLIVSLILFGQKKPDESLFERVLSNSTAKDKQLCKKLIELVRDCWNHDPNLRIVTSEVKNKLEKMKKDYFKDQIESYDEVARIFLKQITNVVKDIPLSEHRLNDCICAAVFSSSKRKTFKLDEVGGTETITSSTNQDEVDDAEPNTCSKHQGVDTMRSRRSKRKAVFDEDRAHLEIKILKQELEIKKKENLAKIYEYTLYHEKLKLSIELKKQELTYNKIREIMFGVIFFGLLYTWML